MLDLYEAKTGYDEGIPSGLDEMEPGPILAAFLSGRSHKTRSPMLHR